MQVYTGRWAADGALHNVAVKVCPFTDRSASGYRRAASPQRGRKGLPLHRPRRARGLPPRSDRARGAEAPRRGREGLPLHGSIRTPGPAVREAFHHEVITLTRLALGNQPHIVELVRFGAVEHVGGALVLEGAQGVAYCAPQDPGFAHLFLA